MTYIKTFSAILLLTIFSASCTSTKSSTTSTFWVNSMKTDCDAGVGKTQCLQIYKGNDLDNAEWTHFYASIEGFTFEPGFLQKLEVTETQLETEDMPADASSIKYKLVKVLEKTQDPRMALHDIWAATHINGNEVDNTANVPTLEINITKMKAFGTDGCNNYTGGIENLTTSTITFGPLASTRKMCADMQIPDAYNKALFKSVSYKRENLNLYFYDSDGNETIRFKKVD